MLRLKLVNVGSESASRSVIGLHNPYRIANLQESWSFDFLKLFIKKNDTIVKW